MNRGAGKRLLVTDLDNTLWDWFAAWHASFSAFLSTLEELSGVPASVLEKEIRPIHQARGTTEYSNLINEIPSIIRVAAGRRPADVFDRALHAQNSARLRATSLYPGVMDGLRGLRAAGVRVVGYTESVSYWTEWRIRVTGLDGVLNALYSAPDHDLPRGMTVADLRGGYKRQEAYGLTKTKHLHVPRGVVKPCPEILQGILHDENCGPDEAVYLGDSLMKDIAMAQMVGVLDVHAEYGLVQLRPEYRLLQRVSHWSDEDVERERSLAREAGDVKPTLRCAASFSEILPLMGLGSR